MTTQRKKRLRIIQISLLFFGVLVLIVTYGGSNKNFEGKIKDKDQKKVETQINNSKEIDGDVFINIEYSGLDLAGNRYILKSAEAFNSDTNSEIVNMRSVQATFYFKDNTVLNVWSDEGEYNNQTLDMKFRGSVKAIYENSTLYAGQADYSNSKSFLIISNNVKIDDIRGKIVADKLLFDIKKQKLNIASFNDGKINANIKLKWKKVLEF